MERNAVLRVGFDMDDVICDTYGALARWASAEFGLSIPNTGDRAIQSYLTQAQVAGMKAMLDEGSFFGALKPFEGAVETLKAMTGVHDVFIVTAAMEHPACMPYKFQWIEEFLPFFDPLKVVFCGEKYVANLDYLVDDTPRHFERFQGEGVVYSAPKNREENRYARVNDWADVADFFEGRTP